MYRTDKIEKINIIFNYIQEYNIYEAKKIFFETIKTIDDMYLIILYAFQNNKDIIGKQIIDFKFQLKRNGEEYYFSPFDFFCYVCKNDYSEILFRIIEDSYFWQKNKVIFEQEYEQTPRQWLISTSAYICSILNKISLLKILCDKYNITYFDAKQITLFDIAKKNNNDELTKFLNERYLTYQETVLNESSLYAIPTIVAENEMYMQTSRMENK